MDHNWNLIPPIPGSFGWIFLKLSFFPFLGHWTQKLSAPSAAISSLNSIPVSCIKNFWLSNNIFEPCCLLYWQMFNVLTDPPPFYYSFKLWWIFFCSCNCELAASRSFCTLLHTTHCCDDLLPTRWQLGIPTSTILWLGVPHHLQKESRYTWLWKVISLQHYIPLKGRNKESELSLC